MQESDLFIYAGVLLVSIVLSMAIAGGLTMMLKVRQGKGRKGSQAKFVSSAQVSLGGLYDNLLLLQDEIVSQKPVEVRIQSIRQMILRLNQTDTPQRDLLSQLTLLLNQHEKQPDQLLLPLMDILQRMKHV